MCVAARRPVTGYTQFELDGTFDRTIEAIDPHWFWLLFGKKDYLCASLKSLDKLTKAAILTFEVKDEPRTLGRRSLISALTGRLLMCGWFLTQPGDGEKKQVKGDDAVAEDYESKDISIVEGREVRVWTKIEPVEGRRGQSRHYPATDQTLPPKSEPRRFLRVGPRALRVVQSSYHAGQFGYCDPGERWMCEKCYDRYVMQRDLAFVDEL